MEGQSVEQLWKKRKYGGRGNEEEDLPPFEEVENDGRLATSNNTMMEDERPERELEQDWRQPFASTSNSDFRPSSNPPAPQAQSRLSRFSTSTHCHAPFSSTSQPSNPVPSSFRSTSQKFPITRRGPAPASLLFGEPDKTSNPKPTVPSRKIPLTSQQTKLFNRSKSTAPLRVYSKPSTGGLVAAGGLGPTLSIKQSSSFNKEGSIKAKETIGKGEEGNSSEEQWMDLDEVPDVAESDSEEVRDGVLEAAEELVDKINRQFHGQPPSPSSESSSSHAFQVSRAQPQPRPVGIAKAARKSLKCQRLTRSESEEEWEDEEDADAEASGSEEEASDTGEEASDGEDELSDLGENASDGTSEAEIRSRLVPQPTNNVSRLQPPLSTDRSFDSRNLETTTRPTAPTPSLRRFARKSTSPPSIASSSFSPTSLPVTKEGGVRNVEEESTSSNDRASADRRIDSVETDNKEEGVPTKILEEAESSDLSRYSSPVAVVSAQVERSESMVRTRSMDEKAKKSESSSTQVSIAAKRSRGRATGTGVEKKRWIHSLKIDPEEERVEVPANWQPPPQPWLVDDPEDSINECLHDKQLLISFDRFVLCSTSASSYDVSNVVLDVTIEARNSNPGFAPSLTIVSTSSPCALVLDTVTQDPQSTFRFDPDDPLASEPLSVPFSPHFCRKAGTTSLALTISLQFGSAQLDTRHELCSVSSPDQPLIPRSIAPFLNFDDPDAQSGLAITIDVVPLRKQIKSAGEARIEIERRLARMELERERVWVPEAQAIREGEVETKMFKMLDLGAGSYGYDFETKLPYRPGESVRNFRNDTLVNTARFVEAKDEEIHRTSASASEKLLARAHARWGLLNPYPPSIFDRELTCWTHYAPLVVRFSLRYELATLLRTRFLKYGLLSESEIRQILSRLDIEKEKIEKGERRGYDELRREALWIKEQRQKGKNA